MRCDPREDKTQMSNFNRKRSKVGRCYQPGPVRWTLDSTVYSQTLERLLGVDTLFRACHSSPGFRSQRRSRQ